MKLLNIIYKKLKSFFIRLKEENKDNSGFTFIEIMIVLGIIAILTSTVAFGAFKLLKQAREVTAKSQIETYSLALNAYMFDCKQYPTQEQGLGSLWEKPTMHPVPEAWDGPYVNKKIGLDPWDNPYIYIVPGPNNLPFGIKSLGADKTEGGEGINKDILSWE